MRAIVTTGDVDIAVIDSALGYPRAASRRINCGANVPADFGTTTRHAAPERDVLSRIVYPVDGIEARLPAALRSRVVDVTLAVVVEPVIA